MNTKARLVSGHVFPLKASDFKLGLKRYKRAKHSFYYLLALVISQIVLLFPRKFALNLGVFLGDLMFFLSRKERARAVRNLSIAFGTEKSPREILDICRKCFRNLGKGLMEFLQLPKLTPENLSKLVTFDGRNNVDETLKKGKGAIILTAHLGNWELSGASFSLCGYKSNTIVRPVKLQKLDEWVNRRREGTGLKCIGRGASIKSALQCLKRNEVLGILADIDTKADGVFVDFFGKPAYTPRGPVSIALKTGCDLLPGVIIRQRDNTHRLIVEKPIELKITGDTEEDVRYNTAVFTKIIESYVRKYPEQWIWIHDRWKTRDV